MNRQDYVAVSSAIRKARERVPFDEVAQAALDDVVRELSWAFVGMPGYESAAFSQKAFRSACALPEGYLDQYAADSQVILDVVLTTDPRAITLVKTPDDSRPAQLDQNWRHDA